MSEQEPEYVWEFPPEKRRGGRGWLIGVLIAAAIAIAIAVFLLVVRPGASAEPEPTSSATQSPTSSVTASPTPTASATTPAPTPTASDTTQPTPIPTASSPAPADPALPVFRNKVQPLLDDATTGLSFAGDASAQEGVQIVDQLRGDAGRLSDAVAPSSISQQWAAGVQDYGSALDRLRSAFEDGTSTAAQLSVARSARNALEDLIGG